MHYGNIPTQVLNEILGSYYDLAKGDIDYTVKDELAKLKEDLIWAEWVYTNNRLESLVVWTKHYAAIMCMGVFGNRYLSIIDRNPPSPKITQKKV